MCNISSRLVTPSRLLPGIHGLRGAAAVAVVVYHTILIAGTSATGWLTFAGKYFGYSVHLFFVLSAFSLMYSTLPTTCNKNWVQTYLIKRFFRIAPLFYFMILLSVSWRYASRVPPAMPELLTNITFTFGLVPPYTGGLVMGG